MRLPEKGFQENTPLGPSRKVRCKCSKSEHFIEMGREAVTDRLFLRDDSE